MPSEANTPNEYLIEGILKNVGVFALKCDSLAKAISTVNADKLGALDDKSLVTLAEGMRLLLKDLDSLSFGVTIVGVMGGDPVITFASLK